ncbi:hypothetical protein CPC08DRAFT_818454 [Agrocybe pediades]|nr:hypothetical protein CPC08DRAFT_818454 [Agrocybe pediades]
MSTTRPATNDPGSMPPSYTNSVLISGFLSLYLTGVYTAVFLVSLYISVQSRKLYNGSRSVVIIGSITASYIATVALAVLDWMATQEGLLLSDVFNVPILEASITSYIALATLFISADALLAIFQAWRAFHVCGRSFRRSLLSTGVFMVEIVLVIARPVYATLLGQWGSRITSVKVFRRVIVAQFVVDAAMNVSIAASSIVSTSVICYQIYAHSTPSTTSRGRYRNIADTLIQSSAIYSAATVLNAILVFLLGSEGWNENSTILSVESYLSTFIPFIAGLVPCIMIARLSPLSSQQDSEVLSLHLPSSRNSRRHTSSAQLPPQDSSKGDVEMQRNEDFEAWRAFHVCGQSFRRASLPIGMFIMELVLLVSGQIYALFVTFTSERVKIQHILDKMVFHSALLTFFANMSKATSSIVSTWVICHQIYAYSARGSGPRKRYRRIVETLIQSSALYSALATLSAVLDILTSLVGPVSALGVVLAQLIIGQPSAPMSGLVPCLMVARLSLPSSSEQESEVSSAHLPSFLMVEDEPGSSQTGLAPPLDKSQDDVEMQQNRNVKHKETDEVITTPPQIHVK